MQKLTRAGVGLATAGLALLGLGMGMGNLELLVLSAIPILLLATSLASQPEGRPTGARGLSTRTPRRSDLVEVEVRFDPPAGADIVEVHAPLPAGFSLESGSNVVLATRHRVFRFRVRAHARGSHDVGAVRAETIDPRGLVAPLTTDIAPPEALTVTPRAFHADKLRRRIRGRARMLLPDREEARVGAGSTDFRELREYAWGDPPKSINWKATARRVSAQGGKAGRSQAPLVNEYEKEGRSTVFVLLDGGADMRVGTALENGLDHAVEASLSAARLFMLRGARVGAATFGAKSALPAPPDAGSGHVHRIERALAPGEPDAEQTPTRVLATLQRHLAGARPVMLVITRVTPRNVASLRELVRHMRVLTGGRGGRASPVYIIDVRALGLAPTGSPAWDAARNIVEAEDAEAARELTSAGARVVPWRPGVEDFRAALVRREIT